MVTSSTGSSARSRKTADKSPAKATAGKAPAAAKKATPAAKAVKPGAARTAAQTVAKTSPAKTSPAKATPAKSAKPPAAKASTTAKPRSRSKAPTPEQRYKMTQEAAYYLAEKGGFAGDAAEYWIRAEAQIDTLLAGKRG